MSNTVEDMMEAAQVFASAWSLVGGRFDFGGGMQDAQKSKAELRAAITTALAEAEARGMERGAQECDHWQRLGNTKHQCGAYIAGAIRGIASKLAVAAEVGK